MTAAPARWFVALGGLAGVAVVVAGCGGDDEASDISKDEFVEQADQICADAAAELDDEVAELDGTDTDAVVALLLDEALPSLRRQLDDIRDLGFPADDAELLEELLDDTEAVVDETEDRLEEDDPEAVLAGDPFEDVNERLTAYGLDACGDNDGNA